MKGLISALAVAGLVFLAGCDGSTTSSGSASTYTESKVAVVKYVNDSQRSDTYVEVETTHGNLLLLKADTQVFLQAADFSGFDNSGVAPNIRYTTILQPGQTVEYQYEPGDVDYAAPRTEYTVSRIYVYQLAYPTPPAVTED